MGSATRQSLTHSRAALAGVKGGADLALGTQLFAAGRALAGSAQLRAVVADPAIEAQAKATLLTSVFGSTLDAKASSVLATIASLRWSSQDDLLGAIEDAALRSCAIAAGSGAQISGEIFTFSQAVASDADLELALGSKMGDPAAKAALVSTLLSGKANPATVVIVSSLVQQPRGRRIGALLAHAADVVADQANNSIATVTAAAPLSASQLTSLATSLAKVYGRELTLNLVVDPSIIGGLRVQVGDEVIDGSISSRINDVRLQLA
jgi:F-type H+-transporting ATPase subunit delta